MPFKSKAQQGFMFSEKPRLAKKFASDTDFTKPLPAKSPSTSAVGANPVKKQKPFSYLGSYLDKNK